MPSWRDRLNRLTNATRFAVCRVFVHLRGDEVAPLLGVLNRAAQDGIESEGDLQLMGERLVEVCQSLLQYDLYWRSAANEGDVFWDEGAAGDYVEELFTDSAQRYYSSGELEQFDDPDAVLSLPATRNLVVMLAIAYEGESLDLETDLASISALKTGLKSIINLHYQERLRAIQIHFSPARFGDELTDDQLLLNFPELIPL